MIETNLPPKYFVVSMKTGETVGYHSYDEGFVPYKNSELQPHPTSIPNHHIIDRSVDLRKNPEFLLE